MHPFEEQHVEPFIQDLHHRNLREFNVLYEADPFECIQSKTQEDLAHSVIIDGKIVMIMGVSNGLFWSMFAKETRKHWRGMVRHSPKAIDFYHQFYDHLYAEIWDQNNFTCQWVVHLGFEPIGFGETDKGHRLVRFVRCKSWYDDVDSKSLRPVMH